MLNLFGAIANGLGRMLPGYLNGYRMAIQDNWNDLNNYNRVQAGELQNLWTEAAMRPSYMQLLAETAMKQLGALDASGEFRIKQQQWPGRMWRGAMLSEAAPEMTGLQIQGAMSDQQRKIFDNSQYPNRLSLFDSVFQDSLRSPQWGWGQDGTSRQDNVFAQSQGGGFGFNPFNAKPFAPGGIFDAEAAAREKAQVPTAARS